MLKSENLLSIPGVGPKIANLLNELDIRKVSDLKKRSPKDLYRKLENIRGKHIDRCVLYTFRCAVYYANNDRHDPDKLKWWFWKDV